MGSNVRGSYRLSNESLLERLSCDIFITNFPVHLSAKELWNTCVQYGTVQYVYIPKKLSKQGKPFALARFNKVNDVDTLIRNLRLIWLGNFRIYANVAWLTRESKPKSFSQNSTPKEPMHVNSKPKEHDSYGYTPSFAKEEVNDDQVILDSFQSIDTEHNIMENSPDHVENSPMKMENSPDHVENFDIHVENSHEQLENYPDHVENSHVHVENFIEKIENSPNHVENYSVHMRNSHVYLENYIDLTGDPFGLKKRILEIKKKRTNVEQAASGSDPVFPPGFTPLNSNQLGIEVVEKKCT
uniref:RRM domain-containing protein n=1 Tax=Tanacetum cinerariifolium TaxID=118510 RepID=A0A6L2P1H0_TANCI|nr:hypothetical protein [Tanacetum cinerariifolium]